MRANASKLSHAELDAARQARATPSTRFRTGSVSKTLTAAAAALLHDRGRLDLDAAVQKYVPAYPQKQWTVTTRQLLGDVAGVHRIRGDANDQMPRGYCATVDEALKTANEIAGMAPLAAIATK